jgi:hypothetical protein
VGLGSVASNGEGWEALALNTKPGKRGGWSWWYLLFVVQFLVALWPPLYNRLEPTLMGIPFFYWFQLLWVLVSAVFTAVVYFATND